MVDKKDINQDVKNFFAQTFTNKRIKYKYNEVKKIWVQDGFIDLQKQINSVIFKTPSDYFNLMLEDSSLNFESSDNDFGVNNVQMDKLDLIIDLKNQIDLFKKTTGFKGIINDDTLSKFLEQESKKNDHLEKDKKDKKDKSQVDKDFNTLDKVDQKDKKDKKDKKEVL